MKKDSEAQNPKAVGFELNLDRAALRLEGLEDTIINRVLDRAQWCMNDAAYIAGRNGFDGEDTRSLFDMRLYCHEEMDAKFGRYHIPEERPFNSGLPEPLRMTDAPNTELHIADYNSINLTQAIMQSYLLLLPKICPPGDDGQYGLSVEHDVYALQTIAQRVHYGAFYVAECKYRTEPDAYDRLIKEKDHDTIIKKLTRKDVEQKIIARVLDKVKQAQAKINSSTRNAVVPDEIMVYYRDFLIPATKHGQALYLLNRAVS